MSTCVILHKRQPVCIEDFCLSSCHVTTFMLLFRVPHLPEYKTILLPISEFFRKVPKQNVLTLCMIIWWPHIFQMMNVERNLSYIQVNIVSYNCKWNNLSLLCMNTQDVIKPCLKITVVPYEVLVCSSKSLV